MDLLKYFTDIVVENNPGMRESFENNNLGVMITAGRINNELSKMDVCKEFNISLEELTLIEAGMIKDYDLYKDILKFLKMEEK